jgi:hypothetical protein
VFRDAVSEIGLEPGLVEDCLLMASELAANTLHARAAAGAGGGGDRLVSGVADMGGELITSAGPAPSSPSAAVPAEFWLYLRGLGVRRELVCKVFDSYRGWRHGWAPSIFTASGQAEAGRGLQIVHELSGGRWGVHLTRARLGGLGVRGKAVWFAVPAPLAHARLADVTGLRAYTLSADVTATRAQGRLSARQAGLRLRTMLDERGLRSRLVRAGRPGCDVSVLSVCRNLTVWCRSDGVSLTTPQGSVLYWEYADLVEAAEQTVRWHEELDMDLAEAALAPAGRHHPGVSVQGELPELVDIDRHRDLSVALAGLQEVGHGHAGAQLADGLHLDQRRDHAEQLRPRHPGHRADVVHRGTAAVAD